MPWRDWSLSAVMAGFLAVLVSYSGPLVIFFQAAQSAGVSTDVMTSWVWAISLGAAISGIVLSVWLKVPVVTAWSAPGTALLVTLFPGLSLGEAVGAYMTAAALLFVIGVSGSFDRLIAYIPRGIAAGMMAGILFQFGVGAFQAVGSMPALALGMFISHIVFRRLIPRYAIVLVLLVGVAISVGPGGFSIGGFELEIARPMFFMPEFSWTSTLSLALPLALVSLTGQFLPGMAILRVSGYATQARPILAVTSLASLGTAVFGGITVVLAAITAALCTGPDAHEDPRRRYVAGVANGAFYLVGALFAGSIVHLFTSLPTQFVAILAGLALLGAIGANLIETVQAESHREAALITFVATASGMTFLGLASAFWGVVLGALAHLVLHKPWRKASG
ncbi:MAG: benzoate/H(+) symporter BenE family transporter [Pigmentiphaga sp.]|nr:benzoate/H(+) symporter BenE family transporter [Pigmentiphaga sp.]